MWVEYVPVEPANTAGLNSFVDGFRRAMRVSSDMEGEVVPLTQQKLAERSGVGRTTIARYVSMESDDEEIVNPDPENDLSIG